MPASNSFIFIRGEDPIINWTIRASAVPTSAIVNITSWTFAFKVKRADADADPSLVTGTTTIQSAVGGTCQTVISAAETTALLGDYHYSLWRTNAGAMACLSKGFLSIGDTVQV